MRRRRPRDRPLARLDAARGRWPSGSSPIRAGAEGRGRAGSGREGKERAAGRAVRGGRRSGAERARGSSDRSSSQPRPRGRRHDLGGTSWPEGRRQRQGKAGQGTDRPGVEQVGGESLPPSAGEGSQPAAADPSHLCAPRRELQRPGWDRDVELPPGGAPLAGGAGLLQLLLGLGQRPPGLQQQLEPPPPAARATGVREPQRRGRVEPHHAPGLRGAGGARPPLPPQPRDPQPEHRPDAALDPALLPQRVRSQRDRHRQQDRAGHGECLCGEVRPPPARPQTDCAAAPRYSLAEARHAPFALARKRNRRGHFGAGPDKGLRIPQEEFSGADAESCGFAARADLVKNHLMYAVREEVEVLKEQIKELAEKNSRLERENSLLKNLASPEQLQKFRSHLPLEGLSAAAEKNSQGAAAPAQHTAGSAV